MNRHVAKEVPPNAVLVQPSNEEPSTSEVVPFTVPVSEEYPTGREMRVVVTPWHMNSGVARLLGEAKSLPKELSICITGCTDFVLWGHWIAWYASRKEVHIYNLGNSYYLTRGN